jgi:hypothetical protein
MAGLLKTRARVRRPVRPTAAGALVVALLAAAGYAVFADGAVPPAQAAWLQVGVCLAAAFAAAAWLGADRLRAGAPPAAVAGLVLLALLVAWTAVSLAWSVAPDRTWTEVNRTLAYVLVAAVALLAGAAPRTVERVALGWLAIAVAAAVYALAGKVLPGVIDDAEGMAVLRAPLEAPGALGLVCVLGVPVALRVAADRSRRPLGRGGALVGLMLLLVCAGLTYSRAAFLALAVALLVLTAAGGARLRGLLAFALGAVAAAPALAYGWSDDALSRSGAALGDRIDAGLLLGALLLVGAAALVAAAFALTGVERRGEWGRRRSQRAWFALAAVALALTAAGVTALATSDRGLGGSIEEAVDDFTDAGADPGDEPDRLLSTSSAGRSAWWQEALGAFADEPVRGWGGGSFMVSRRLYRATLRDSADPHDLPLRFAAETGAVGLALGVGGLALLFAAAAGGVRRRAKGSGWEAAETPGADARVGTWRARPASASCPSRCSPPPRRGRRTRWSIATGRCPA